MATTVTKPTVLFPNDFDARSEFETPSRGYLSDVVVQLDDGSRFQVSFVDLTRLGQNLADEISAGRRYYAEPNLIILPEVTTEAIRRSVENLWRDGYFDNLKTL